MMSLAVIGLERIQLSRVEMKVVVTDMLEMFINMTMHIRFLIVACVDFPAVRNEAPGPKISLDEIPHSGLARFGRIMAKLNTP